MYRNEIEEDRIVGIYKEEREMKKRNEERDEWGIRSRSIIWILK